MISWEVCLKHRTYIRMHMVSQTLHPWGLRRCKNMQMIYMRVMITKMIINHINLETNMTEVITNTISTEVNGTMWMTQSWIRVSIVTVLVKASIATMEDTQGLTPANMVGPATMGQVLMEKIMLKRRQSSSFWLTKLQTKAMIRKHLATTSSR